MRRRQSHTAGTRLHLALSATKPARFIHLHRIKNNMKTSKRKAVGGHHSTPTAFKNTHANIAPGCKKRYTIRKCCATFHTSPICWAGAENTVSDSEVHSATSSAVFSRPKFMVLDVKVLSIRKDGSMAESMFSPPSRSSRVPEKRRGWFFQSHSGARTMTTVNTTTTPKAAPLGHTPAISTSILARQPEIENALSTALYFIRLPSTESGLRAATGRAIRATSMLKQACAESTSGRA